MQDENEELKGSTTRLKSQDEENVGFKAKVKKWEIA